jgi:gamma-glutamyltranspeptidase/glutathione hydrolase
MDALPLIRRWTVLAAAALVLAAAATPAPERHGIVAADHALASEAGAEVIRAGGNAVDAAVATALAAGVVQPTGSGLGGGGFAVVSLNGAVHVLDFRETAPAAATREMFQGGASSEVGGASVATPGEGPGLAALVERWGHLSRRDIAAPALRLAQRGFPLGPHVFRELVELGDGRAALESALFARTGVAAGERAKRTRLARAITAWVDHGGADFQRGWIAEDFVATARARGGVLTASDLAAWTPKDRAPLVGRYRGWRVETMPPPSSGGAVLLQMLGVLEGYDLGRMDPLGAEYLHLLAETMKHAYADRSRFMGDPDRVDVPIASLLAPARLDGVRASFDPARTFGPERYGMAAPLPDDHGTQHISVLVGEQAVALTTTVNLSFGSQVVGAASGVLLNDQMDDFAADGPNTIAPGARPLSSMAPTVLTSADGGTRVVIGASGGPVIISAVLQVLLDLVDFGMDPEAAVSAPRIHHAWKPNVLKLEAGVGTAAIEALRAKGHEIEVKTFESAVQVAVRRGDQYGAASDPRRGGAPAEAR